MNTLPADRPVPLYEQAELAAITGGLLRPGGMELTSRALHLCGLSPDASLLDVGCGPGHTLPLCAAVFNLRPIGLDKSASMLRRTAAAHPGIPLIRAEAAAIPLSDAGFDGIISECVLSLTGDIAASLGEMWRVLRPGGKLALTDIFTRESDRHKAPCFSAVHSCLTTALPLEAITAAVKNAGFGLLHLEDHSAALTQLAGQIIFTCGSLEQFWQLFMGAEEAKNTCCAMNATRPGYYLLIAQKQEDFHG